MNILFTSAGRRGYLIGYFRQALEEAGQGGQLHAANSTPLSTAMQMAERSTVTPAIYDSAYIPYLLRYCRQNHIDALIPLFDIDLPVLAAHRAAFMDAGVQVVVSPPAAIAVCNDKWESYQWLRAHDLPAPATYLSWPKAVQALADGALRWPLVVKPRWGMGSIAVYTAHNQRELEVFFEMAKREIATSHLKYETAADIEHPVLIQQKLGGTEYGLDVINNLAGSHKAVLIKQKLAMRAGETDSAVTLSHPALAALGAKIGTALGHVGNLDVDVFEDAGVLYVLEMNARFGGGYPFSHAAGANLPLALVHWLAGQPEPPGALAVTPGILSQKDIAVLSAPLDAYLSYAPPAGPAQLAEALRRLDYLLVPPLRTRGIDLDAYAEKLCAHAFVLVARTLTGQLAGLAAAYLNSPATGAYLSLIAVEPACQSKGVGRTLLNRVEAAATAAGMPHIRLEVRENNTYARQFYESLGYTLEGPAPPNALFYRRPLVPAPPRRG